MNLGLIALLVLVAVVAIAFFLKVNIGILSILAAVVLGLGSGQFTGKQIISGFSSSLFLTLAGITIIFGIVTGNGSLELLMKKLIAKLGRATVLVPVVFFIFCWLVSAAGPGLIPTAALVAVMAIPVARETGYNPLMIGMIGVHAANAGRFTTLTVEGELVNTILAEQGYTESILTPLCLSVTIIAVILSVVTWAWYKSWKVKPVAPESLDAGGKFDRNQILSLIGMLVMVLLILVGGLNAGLSALCVAAVLFLLRVADEKTIFKKMPWGTIFMVIGVGMLMNLVIELGGIDLLSSYLASIMTPNTAASLSAVTGGVMSWFSSTLGVVMPTLLPTVSSIIDSVGGNVTVLEIVGSIVMASSSAGLSPASTAGSLILSGISGDPVYSAEPQFKADKVFIELFAWAAVSIVIIALLDLTGYFRWFI